MNSKSIQEQIQSKIEGCSKQVAETVIDKIANEEINRRSSVISAAIKQLDSMQNELKQLEKPDNVTYTTSGDKNESYSAGRFEAIGAQKESIEKLSTAIDVCIKDNNEAAYSKLSEIMLGKHDYIKTHTFVVRG